MRYLRIGLLLLAFGAVTACGDDSGDDHDHDHDHDRDAGQEDSGSNAGRGGSGGSTGDAGPTEDGGTSASQFKPNLPRPPSGKLPDELRPPR